MKDHVQDAAKEVVHSPITFQGARVGVPSEHMNQELQFAHAIKDSSALLGTNLVICVQMERQISMHHGTPNTMILFWTLITIGRGAMFARSDGT